MRLRSILVPLLLVTGLAVPMAARRTPQGRGIGLEVFDDINFRGRSATIIEDSPDLRRNNLEGRISSLRVAPGEVWQVCAGVNYEGRCQVFSDDQSDLRRGGWNDAIMSVRRVRTGRGAPPPDRDDRPGTRGLELFAGTRFSGERVLIEQPESNLRRMNFNDRASSLRVPRGEVWEVCVNADYDDCRVVDGDISDLSVLGLNRQISSARPRRFEGGGRGGFPPPQRPRVILYDDRGFRGHETVIEEETPNLRWASDTAGSLRVVSGRWELCEDVRFGGRCVTVTEDVPDLGRVGLRDRISSLRPR